MIDPASVLCCTDSFVLSVTLIQLFLLCLLLTFVRESSFALQFHFSLGSSTRSPITTRAMFAAAIFVLPRRTGNSSPSTGSVAFLHLAPHVSFQRGVFLMQTALQLHCVFAGICPMFSLHTVVVTSVIYVSRWNHCNCLTLMFIALWAGNFCGFLPCSFLATIVSLRGFLSSQTSGRTRVLPIIRDPSSSDLPSQVSHPQCAPPFCCTLPPWSAVIGIFFLKEQEQEEEGVWEGKKCFGSSEGSDGKRQLEQRVSGRPCTKLLADCFSSSWLAGAVPEHVAMTSASTKNSKQHPPQQTIRAFLFAYCARDWEHPCPTPWLCCGEQKTFT